jgi:hypothetical protein
MLANDDERQNLLLSGARHGARNINALDDVVLSCTKIVMTPGALDVDRCATDHEHGAPYARWAGAASRPRGQRSRVAPW